MAENTKLRGYDFFLNKAYFDKGYGFTNYIFKLIAVFGLTSQELMTTIWILGFYSLFCYFFGRWLYNSKLVLAETEVSNRFNLFVQEMRAMSGAKSLNTCSA